MKHEAILQFQGKEIKLTGTTGSDDQIAIDISNLYEDHGLIVFDPHLANTAIVKSGITWIDSTHGKLYYCGYNIEDLVEKSTFVETSYLLSHGKLPNQAEYDTYSHSLSKHSMIHESMRNFFEAFPGDAHPVAILATMVTALSSYYPATYEENIEKGIDIKSRLLAKVRTLAAWSYRKSNGLPIIYPRDELPYCTNFLNMMFASPVESYEVTEAADRILNQVLILYSDHEQNVSTSTVRLVGSTQANLFACINAGMCALWGSRESNANIPPIQMLNEMVNHNQSPEVYFQRFIQGTERLRSNGLGHSQYLDKDPRSVISQKLFHGYRKAHPEIDRDPVIQKALEVEAFSTGHPFFMERKLYPNLDFYSALIFRVLGIPSTMNNVIRVIGKLSGWLAHWMEQRNEIVPASYRPRQVYDGERPQKDYQPITAR